MTVAELKEILKDLPGETMVCWDSHGSDIYFGSNYDVEKFHTDDILEDDPGDCDHIPEGAFTALVLR